MGEPQEHQAECEKPDTKAYILYDFTYVKCKPGKN